MDKIIIIAASVCSYMLTDISKQEHGPKHAILGRKEL
jgi:hypothetical protein